MRREGRVAAMAAGLLLALGAVLAWAAEGGGPSPKQGKGRQKGTQQQGEEGGGGKERRPPPPHPLLVALDTDGDGELSAEEIANAATSLRKLDKNGDGKITRDELRPPPPPGKGEGGQGEGARKGGSAGGADKGGPPPDCPSPGE